MTYEAGYQHGYQDAIKDSQKTMAGVRESSDGVVIVDTESVWPSEVARTLTEGIQALDCPASSVHIRPLGDNEGEGWLLIVSDHPVADEEYQTILDGYEPDPWRGY